MTFRGKEVLVWSLNNYLGLANHPDVRQGGRPRRRPNGAWPTRWAPA
jgi:7-keto-8-aminopelargonate synthetase-like enzyme